MEIWQLYEDQNCFIWALSYTVFYFPSDNLVEINVISVWPYMAALTLLQVFPVLDTT